MVPRTVAVPMVPTHLVGMQITYSWNMKICEVPVSVVDPEPDRLGSEIICRIRNLIRIY